MMIGRVRSSAKSTNGAPRTRASTPMVSESVAITSIGQRIDIESTASMAITDAAGSWRHRPAAISVGVSCCWASHRALAVVSTGR